jgi:RecJ-like exonuclease
MMSEKTNKDAQPEALATFAAAARNSGIKSAGHGVSATAETSGKPGDLQAEEKDGADIMGGNATGDKKRVDAAIAHHAKTDKRAG